MRLKDKIKAAIEKKLKPEELLKYLCPFEVEFKLKIFANRNNHDYVLLLQVQGDEPFIEDPRDLQAFITQLAAGRDLNTDITVTRAKYEEEVYECIYFDFKKEEQKEEEHGN